MTYNDSRAPRLELPPPESNGGISTDPSSPDASARQSQDILNSRERLLQETTASIISSTAPADSVPYAPPQVQRWADGNPAEATNRRLVSLEAKVINNEMLHDHPEFADLNFWPTILSKRAVMSLVVLYAATASSIGVLVWQTFQDSDHSFHLSSENVRLISRYFPSIIGTITVILFRQTVREALRMEPFINMSDQKGNRNPGISPADGVGGAWFPWQSLTTAPLSFLSVSSIVVQFFVSFVVSFKVALLASSERIKDEQHFWILTVRLWPALLLIAIYVIMIIYTIFLSVRTRGKSTGLKWDPASIADYASLFAHCNALKYFSPLELRHNLRPEHVMPTGRLFRLGYWNRTQDNPIETDIVYGIGVGFPGVFSTPTSALLTLSLTDQTDSDGSDELERKPLGSTWYHPFRKQKPAPNVDEPCQKPGACAHGTWPRCEHYPYKENPGCSQKIILFCSVLPVAVLVLSIYALIINLPIDGFSVPNDFALPSNITVGFGQKNHTFAPIDPVDPYSNILVWALILRSAPTYIAGIFTSTIVTWIDLNMRFMQPFRNMFGKEPEKTILQRVRDCFNRWRNQNLATERATSIQDSLTPATAADSILLAYITQSPLFVPLTAWNNGHYKVCIYSALNTISPLFPIFVGGLLTVVPTQDKKRVECTFSLSAYIGIMVFVIFYSILLPMAIPRAHRRLPRQLYSLADLMVLCHESKFMSSPHLNIASKKQTPTKAHMEARILLTDNRFLFGKYTGRDGRKHIGFDVTQCGEDEFGRPIRLPDPVEHIPPEDFFHRLHRVSTSKMEQGRSAIRAMTGGMTANLRNPFSQRNRRIEAEGDYEMSGAIAATEPTRPSRSAAEMASGYRPQGHQRGGRSRFGPSSGFSTIPGNDDVRTR